MGVLYETYKSTRKTCKMCGCIMEQNSTGDICLCCLDDMNETDEEVNLWDQ